MFYYKIIYYFYFLFLINRPKSTFNYAATFHLLIYVLLKTSRNKTFSSTFRRFRYIPSEWAVRHLIYKDSTRLPVRKQKFFNTDSAHKKKLYKKHLFPNTNKKHMQNILKISLNEWSFIGMYVHYLLILI